MTAPDVLAPAKLGPVTLRNRIIKSATFEGKTPDALVTDELIEFHRRPAAGGVGMSTVAYCAVAPEGRTEYGQLWMRPDALPGLRQHSPMPFTPKGQQHRRSSGTPAPSRIRSRPDCLRWHRRVRSIR